jgi:hypothetical protein
LCFPKSVSTDNLCGAYITLFSEMPKISKTTFSQKTKKWFLGEGKPRIF